MIHTLRPPRLCIFDLDGTLVDSLRDIGESVNHALELLGFPPRPIDDYRFLVGEGVPVLCRRAIGATHPHMVERLSELARALYRVRLIVHTKPYAGILELVNTLRKRGVRLAVLSNKPHESTRRIVDQFWTHGTFDPVYGYLHYDLRKPDPTFARLICEQAAVRPGETWFIGDTPTDLETARRLGSARRASASHGAFARRRNCEPPVRTSSSIIPIKSPGWRKRKSRTGRPATPPSFGRHQRRTPRLPQYHRLSGVVY